MQVGQVIGRYDFVSRKSDLFRLVSRWSVRSITGADAPAQREHHFSALMKFVTFGMTTKVIMILKQ